VPRWRDYLEPGDEPPLPDRPEPERDVPHPIGVIFGCQLGWSPGREGQAPGLCRECGNTIPHRSRLVCAGCLSSGFDDQVRGLLAITPAKPRHRPDVVRPRPRPPSKKKRKRKKSGVPR
jgi:hypothetical protein